MAQARQRTSGGPSTRTTAYRAARRSAPACAEDELASRQLTHARALVACSRELMAPNGTEDANRAVLGRALEHLRVAADADRAFIFRNLEDHQVGPASAMVAEVAASHAASHMPAHAIPLLGDPQPELLTPVDILPWASVPGRNRQRLASGKAVGGALAELFAETPDFLARLQADLQPALSVQFVPIFCGDEWWGYVGFDDCRRPRAWEETEVAMLRAAAEFFSSTLLRWQAEAVLGIRERYEHALAQFSHGLLSTPTAPEQEREILNQALGTLVTATQASRAYVIRNLDDPELGLCAGIYAEACSPGVPPHIQNPANQRFPWSLISHEMRLALAAGHAYGGPIEQAFSDTPSALEMFRRQRAPLLSVETVPINVDHAWWGFVGFDQTHYARRWTEHELRVLMTAAEMLGSALQRWQAEAQVVRAREELETRVQLRTIELSRRLSAERILAQIAARLIAADEPAGAICETLSDIGALTQAERVVLAPPSQNGNVNTGPPLCLEWHAPGAPPVAGQVERIFRDAPWLDEQLANHKVITLDGAHPLPPEAGAFKELLGIEDGALTVLVPLRARDMLTGVLICANVHLRPDGPPHDVESLEVVAGLLTGLLAREAYLRTLEQQVADRTRELSAFLDFGLLVNEERQLTEGLELGLLRIVEAIDSNAGAIHALDPGKSELRLLAVQGLAPRQQMLLEGLTLSETLAHWLAKPNPPLIIRSDSSDRDLPAAMRLRAYPHVLVVQLRASGAVIGVLSCFARPSAELTINRISLAAAFGEQLGVIVQNHRLQQQAKEVAVITERQRLARELHDAVTQSLYSQTLFTRSAIDALEDGRPEKTREHLHQVEVNASQALREMRVLLHQLRPPDLRHKTLADAVEERLELVERRVGVAAYSAIDDTLILDETTEATLYRVILEALNNTLRHAEASQVDVQIHRAPDGLALFVIDNGRGFDPEDVAPGMGLSNIRERAAQINGELHIDSKPGRGTALLVKVPLSPQQGAAQRPGSGSRAR